MKMENNTCRENGVNGTGTLRESASPGRVVGEQQPTPGRHQATARTKWNKEVNRIVMRCFYMSEPSRRGYRRRMLGIWKERGVFEVSEQRLADQARAIRTNGWLSEVELEEISRAVSLGEENEQNEDVRDESTQPEPEDNGNQSGHFVYNTDEVIQRMERDGCNREKINLAREIMESMKDESECPPNLRNIERRRLREKIAEVNKIIHYLETKDITETNDLLLAIGRVVARRLGVKQNVRKPKAEPWWKRRIKCQISKLRKDLSRLERLKSGELQNTTVREGLERRYYLKKKGVTVVIEELKQRILAKTAKVKRYQERVDQYRQNRMFRTNQKRLFEMLETDENDDTTIPDEEESKNFWSNIWDNPVNHNANAEWLKGLERKLTGVNQQSNFVINVEGINKQLKKTANWKAPGLDGLQGYWLKNISCRERLAIQLQDCIDNNDIPAWFTKGRTVLIIKDKEKGSIASNFRPITCLPQMWKLLTGIMSNDLYQHLENSNLLPDEQKGCRRNSRGTKDQLLIDKMIVKNCKRRKTGLGMAWIDYRKAFDMIPHSWILKCLRLFGAAENMVQYIEKSMSQWQVELSAHGNILGTINVRRGIFQGDSLSPLLFVVTLIPLSLVLREVKAGYDLTGKKELVNHLLYMDDLKLYGKNEKQIDTLINTVRIFSSDIGMEFGIDKCAVLVMKRGKLVLCDGIDMPDGNIIREVEETGYKYLGVLEADDLKHAAMKEVMSKEYFRRIRKILKSKLNGGNVVNAINSRAVSIIRYSAGIVKWTKDDLKKLDRKTRKLLTINKALHPQADVDRLYLKRAVGGRGLLSVEDCVNIEVGSLFRYIGESKERLLRFVSDENILEEGLTKIEVTEERMSKFKNKALHGQFERATEQVRDPESWGWLKRGILKKETEGLLTAAQDQALRTNSIKNRIDKEDVSPMCRLCGEREETVSHIVTECKKLAQREYKMWRHDKIGQVIHWKLCQKYNIPCKDKWYDHDPEGVIENDQVKVLWDFRIQTDHQIEHNRPDIVVLDKIERSCNVIDIACPFDTRVLEKEQEKMEKYQELKREIGKIWSCRKVTVLPIVIGALGTFSKNLKTSLKKIGLDCTLLLQKASLLGTARILRRTLDT